MPSKEQYVALIDRLLKAQEDAKANVNNPIYRDKRTYIISVEHLAMKDMTQDEARKILRELRKKGCFPMNHATCEIDFSAMVDESFFDQKPRDAVFLHLDDVNCLHMFEYRQELLGKKGQPIIKLKALEHIARKMADRDGGNELIDFLRECNVPDPLIAPNTKWRMLYDVFRALATSTDEEHHQILKRLMEDFCHPLRFGGDKERAISMQDDFSDLLEYDNMYFENHRLVDVSKKEPHIAQNSLAAAGLSRETRKAKRMEALKNAPDVFSAFFGASTPTRRPAQQQHQASTKVPEPPKPEPQIPFNIVIHNNNTQANTHQQPSVAVATKEAKRTEVYVLHELKIDMPARAVHHRFQSLHKDLSGFNHALLKALIEAKGSLVPYSMIAQAASERTVDRLTDKEVQDGKSKFISMLKQDLQISTATCEELIQGQGGYRISRKIYE